jgi:opacity protein-like surface antigen
VSPTLTAFAGANVILITYDSKVLGGSAAPGSLSDAILNFNIGASYEVFDNLFVTGSYNYSNSSSDADIRDYDAHRVQMGVQSAF